MRYKDALKYIQSNREGYVEDLKDKIGEDNFRKFELIGIIHRGQESDGRASYGVSQEGDIAYKYANFDEIYKPSLITRITNYINRIL